jgi:AraC-like DNA-binding protein
VLISRNFSPSDDLKPFIRQHYVFEADFAEDLILEDQMFSETAFVRLLLEGEWEGETAPGKWTNAGNAVLFGANASPFGARVRGSFRVAAFSIKPGGWTALFGKPATEYTDRMVPLHEAWADIAGTMFQATKQAGTDAEIVSAMEAGIRTQLKRIGKPKEDVLITRYEAISRLNSTAKVEDVAVSLGRSVRQIERRCLKAFGMSPKKIFQRSRFLDMAMAMRGLSTQTDSQLAALRFFDQSHLNREFWKFANMTPGKFRKTETPLFTEGLKLRSRGEFLFKEDK